MRTAVEQNPVRYAGREIAFTISLGLSEIAHFGGGYMQWLEQADQALYRSKENGRNRASVFGDE